MSRPEPQRCLEIAEALLARPNVMFHVFKGLQQRGFVGIAGPWHQDFVDSYRREVVRLGVSAQYQAVIRRLKDGKWFHTDVLVSSMDEAAETVDGMLRDHGFVLVPGDAPTPLVMPGSAG